MNHPETLAAHGGSAPDTETGALVPPLHLSTTFERGADGSYPRGYVYSREDNPTRRLFESAMTALEGGREAAAFASGMAAASAVFGALRPGDHVMLPDDVYHGIRHVLFEHFVPWGLIVSEVPVGRLDAIERAFRGSTRLVWVETPSNPLLRMTDIAEFAARARKHGALCVVDGTWTTPLMQRPLDLGADLVVHSITKYIGGHSDVLGGVVVAGDRGADLFQRVRQVQRASGPVMDPFSAWLALRGMRSLGARLDRQCATALQVARMLADHPAVTAVHFPGLESDPGHAVAVRQMTRFGAMISFRVRGGEEAAMCVAAATRVFARATSLGGTESLVEHRASMESQPSRTPRDLLRLSIGLEHPDDLVRDLRQALDTV